MGVGEKWIPNNQNQARAKLDPYLLNNLKLKTNKANTQKYRSSFMSYYHCNPLRCKIRVPRAFSHQEPTKDPL